MIGQLRVNIYEYGLNKFYTNFFQDPIDQMCADCELPHFLPVVRDLEYFIRKSDGRADASLRPIFE